MYNQLTFLKYFNNDNNNFDKIMADITTRGRISEEFLNFSNCIFEKFYCYIF